MKKNFFLGFGITHNFSFITLSYIFNTNHNEHVSFPNHKKDHN